MKIGFSSLVCPGWDLATILNRAAEWGFQGVELRGLRGELHLPMAPELAAHPESTRRMFAERAIECVSLGSSVVLSPADKKELARQKDSLREFMELAHRLGCPHVRLFGGEVGPRDTAQAALARTAEALASMMPTAAALNVTLLVENAGDFRGSADAWFLCDAVSHPNLRCCWNQCNALALGERATTSIPRLGGKIGMVHLCDADFDARGVQTRFRPLGEGGAEVGRTIEILKGLGFRQYLMFEWPKLWDDALPAPEAVLPGAAAFLRAKLDEKQAVLSAYKGDKNAPRFAAPRGTAAGAAQTAP